MADRNMVEHNPADEDRASRRRMRRSAILANPARDAGAESFNLLDIPTELQDEVAAKLQPAQDMIESYKPGSRALRSANAGLDGLQALCLTNKKMHSVAQQFLYETVVVSDPYKLEKFRRTLDAKPGLGSRTTTLSVYWYFDPSDARHERHLRKGRDPGAVTPSQFSAALVAVLEKTPNLVTLYLNFDKPPPFEDPDPFELLNNFLRRDISNARGAGPPEAFLPNVATLGIVLPPGGASPLQRTFEYKILEGLLNLPALRHIVIRRNGRGPFRGCEDYTELFRQRKPELCGTITSVDAQIDRRMRWDDLGNIGDIFPAISSLKLSHRGHEQSTIRLPSGVLGSFKMEGLRHLSVDMDSPLFWSRCEWFSESIKFRFCLAPSLETLRIPLRLFRNHTVDADPMLHPIDVLPGTLKSLVLVADMRVYPEADLWDDGDAAVVEDENGDESPYPIRCHLRYSWTIRFLHSLQQSARSYFTGLKMVTLENETNLLDDPGAEEIDNMLINCEEKLVSQLQALRQGFSGQGISFSWSWQ